MEIPNEPGIYLGLSRRQYERIPAVSQSMLKSFGMPTPAHARWSIDNPKAETKEMRLGTVLHCYLLEPDKFKREYIEKPDFTEWPEPILRPNGEPYDNPRRTKEFARREQEFELSHRGKTFMEPGDRSIIDAIGESIAATTKASELLSGEGDNEVGIVWIDEETGLLCKALADRIVIRDGERIAIDIKTCDSARDFEWDCLKRGNHLQAPWYLEGLTRADLRCQRFLHIVLETEPIYGVRVLELDDKALALGDEIIRGYLATYAECIRNGHWPSYKDEIETVQLPRRAFYGTELE